MEYATWGTLAWLGILVLLVLPHLIPFTTWGKRMRGVEEDLKAKGEDLKAFGRQLQQQERATQTVLAGLGIARDDLEPLLGNNTSRQIQAITNGNSSRARKYLTKMRENQVRRAELFAQKPLVATVATMFGDDIGKDRDAQVQERTAKYKQECLGLVTQNKWPSPKFGTKAVPCSLTDIIDGDTVRVAIPSTGENFKVRLVGFDCPETCHPTKSIGHYGLQATHMAERILRQATNISIRLDAEQVQQGWVYDRYGRLTAHILVDGRLMGETLLEEGCAEVLDVFPIEPFVLDTYNRLEASAKASGMGMWKDLNEIQQRKAARYGHPRSTDLINEILGLDDEDRQITNLVKVEARLTLADIIGNLVVKSSHSTVVHAPECRYVATIGTKQNVTVTEESLKTLVPCKVCGGDPLVRESL